MKNIQPYLLPAAVLVLALTQVSTWQRNASINRCISLDVRGYDRDKPDDEQWRRNNVFRQAVRYCNGG